ncbi:hypothetical protein [Blastomonas sp.]|uniref:hypothetical protein n=1 Tax=Blastomonas sp. TaxID=1909299 RepID=UPI0035933665
MTSLVLIDALDTAEAIHERTGPYVDMNFMPFVAGEGTAAREARNAARKSRK